MIAWMRRELWSVLLVWMVALVASGCSRDAAKNDREHPGRKTFEVRGVVREIATDRLHAKVRHEAIPGYMAAMTMEFRLRDAGVFRGVESGDEIEFTLTVTDDEHWIERVRRTGKRESVAPASEQTVVARPRELKPGDPMSDFEFTREDGGRERLGTFKGKAVAFTFFFTRCPIPEFCPRMAKHFAAARNLLLASGLETSQWQLLCLSFDAEFDRPAMLAAYAKAYRGTNSTGWLFGSVATATLAEIAPALDLTVTRDTNGFSHNLRTVVLDPLGRVHRQFDGNEWSAEDLARAVEEAVRAK